MSSTDSKYTGTIKHLAEKGFGFINGGNGKSIFFHMSACKGVEFSQLFKGEEVVFSKVEESDKGFSAKCVELK